MYAGGPEDAVVEGGVDRRRTAVADEAEVEDDDAAAAADQDVGGLEVAVQLAGGVERVDAGDQLGEGVAQAGLVELGRSGRARVVLGDAVMIVDADAVLGVVGPLGGVRADIVAEAHALDVLHRDEPLVGVGDELVEGDEVVVDDAGGGPELVLEAVEAAGLELAQGLEGDSPAALAIEGGVHHTHAAGAEAAQEFVAAEAARGAVGEQHPGVRPRARGGPKITWGRRVQAVGIVGVQARGEYATLAPAASQERPRKMPQLRRLVWDGGLSRGARAPDGGLWRSRSTSPLPAGREAEAGAGAGG
jgi:hypothetical protein